MSGLGLFLLIFAGLLLFGIVCFTTGIRVGLTVFFDTWVDRLDEEELNTLLYLVQKAQGTPTISSDIVKRYKK